MSSAGIPELPGLPAAWNVGRLKWDTVMVSGGTPDSSDRTFWTDGDDPDGTPWVSIGDMSQRSAVRSTVKALTEAGISSKALPRGGAGTVLLAMYASVGEVAHLEIDATWNQAILGIRPLPDRFDQRYLAYALRAMRSVLLRDVRSNTQANLNATQIGDIWLPRPRLDEQRQIAEFLDVETARIDRLVAKQEALIETLRERRQGAIDAAVPTSPPGAPLRRFITLLTSGARGWGDYYAECGSRFLRIGNLPRVNLTIGGDVQLVDLPPSAATESERTRLQRGDLLFSITAYLGSVAVVDDDWAGGYVSQHVALCRLDAEVLDSRFAGWAMLSTTGQNQLKEGAAGGTKVQLALDDIKSLVVPAPSLNEQREIVAYLDSQTAKIDTLIAKSERFIELAKERRAALITAAVTGQIDVRPHAA